MSDYKPSATIVVEQELTDYPSINTADTQQVNNMELGRINDSIESSGSDTDKTEGASPGEPSLIAKAVAFSNHNSENSPALSSDHSTLNMGGSPPPRPREASFAWRKPPTGEQQPDSSPEDALVTEMSEAEWPNRFHEVEEGFNKYEKAYEALMKVDAELQAEKENVRTMKLTAIDHLIKERQKMFVSLQNILGKTRAAVPGMLLPDDPDQSNRIQWSEDFNCHSEDVLDEIEIQARKDYLISRRQCIDHVSLLEHLVIEEYKKKMALKVEKLVKVAKSAKSAILPDAVKTDRLQGANTTTPPAAAVETKTTGDHSTPPPAAVDTDSPKRSHDDSSVNQANRPTREEVRDHGGKVTRPSSTTGVHNTAPAAAAAAVDTDIPKRSLGDDDSSDDQTGRPTAEEIRNHGKTATGLPDTLKTDGLQGADTTGAHSAPPAAETSSRKRCHEDDSANETDKETRPQIGTPKKKFRKAALFLSAPVLRDRVERPHGYRDSPGHF